MIEPEGSRHSSDWTNGASSSHGPADHSINVVIRVRPLITGPSASTRVVRERTANDATQHVDSATAITFPAAGQIQVYDNIASTTRSFAFNVVFEPEATQEEVFEHSGVKRLIDMALDGFACTVFAYGQTSTGKTYTLTGNAFQTEQGQQESSSSVGRQSHQSSRSKKKLPEKGSEENSPKSIGIVQLAFAYLFEQIKRRKLRDRTLYVITVSYLEVYNEQVLDLLNPSPRCLNVRWAKDRGFYAENLFKVECEDIGDLEGVLEEGVKNRQVRSHSMNENSSRSHAVMTITLASEAPDPEDPQGFIRKEGRLCLVDLAGSEKTKRTNSKGGLFVEANSINRSLLVLGNCIACLADPKRRNGHIPYRDSTLTKLLADSLSGNGMTLMVACVSPLKLDCQETINTLRYACRAKRVRMNPVVQMDPRDLLILSLKREVRLLRMENNYLRQNYQVLLNSQNDESSQVDLKDPAMIIPKMAQNRELKGNEKDEQLLSKYMHENEVLRVENVQLNLQRNRLVRDHELVCRENEKLLKKLHSILSVNNDLGKRQASTMAAVQILPSLSSSASSPSLLSLVSQEEEVNAIRSGGGSISMPVPKNNYPGEYSSTKHISNENFQRTHSSKDGYVVDIDQTEEQNGLILIKEKQSRDKHESQKTRSNLKNVRSSDVASSERTDQEQSSMLDLTIRGKSAVNGSGSKIASNARRRN